MINLTLFMKLLLISLIIFFHTYKLYSQGCDEKTIARMIKIGISDKTIEEQCGNIGVKEKVSEKIKKMNSGTVKKNSKNIENPDKNKINSKNIEKKKKKKKKSIRLAIGGAYGKFKYSDSYPVNTNLSGDFDHYLDGGGLGISYMFINKNNYIFGGGLSLATVNGPQNVNSKNKKPDSYTYYSPIYGYYDMYISVKHFASSFVYGLVGLKFDISDTIAFQPNLRIGLKYLEASWEQSFDFSRFKNIKTSYRENSSNVGLEIDLPIMFKFSESFRFGFNFCLCSSNLYVTSDTGEYDFTSVNIFNILFDFDS